MKQTAVEFLVEQLTAIGQLEIPKGSNVITSIINEAKEIEKQQITGACDSNFTYGNNGYPTLGEIYYNETYNKTKNEYSDK
jgi:hypothetical protein